MWTAERPSFYGDSLTLVMRVVLSRICRQPVRRRYDNSRREAGVRATRLRIIEAAKALFIEQGYPATKIESIAEASDTPLPTLYRLFGSKRALLKAVLDTSFVGDDQPVAFGDRPQVQAALGAADPEALIDAFAVICREVKDRSGEIYHVLSTAALVDDEAAELLADVRRQAHTGRSRIVAALRAPWTHSTRPWATAKPRTSCTRASPSRWPAS